MTLRVLAVDDEELNIDIMKEYFEDAKFSSVEAFNGKEALDILKSDNDFNVIVLDRMMPEMDGMEFIKEVKQDPRLKDIPVIMQTAATASHQVAEGIESGVYYYLNKPYNKDVFLSLIHAANDDYALRKELRAKIKEFGQAMVTIEHATFNFKTVEQAKALSVLIGSAAENNEATIFALTELTMNSVEHGNLGITYEEKRDLKIANKWDEEVEKRMNDVRYKAFSATLEVRKNKDEMNVVLIDMGEGFNWKKYMQPSPERMTDPNGRGLLMCMNSGFSRFEYVGKGNEVRCAFKCFQK